MTLGKDELSVRDMLKGLSSMMATLSTRMDDIEGEGRKKRRVAFRNHRTPEDEVVPVATGTSTSFHLTPTEAAATAPPPSHHQTIDPAAIFSHQTTAILPPPTETDEHDRGPATVATLLPPP